MLKRQPDAKASYRIRPQTDHILPDWEALLDTNRPLWNRSKEKSEQGPKVLIATSVGGLSALSVLESLLAVALTLRGAQTHTLLCDKFLPACLRAETAELPDPLIFDRYELPKSLCEPCLNTGQYLFEPLGLVQHVYSSLIRPEEKSEARRLSSEVRPADIEGYRLCQWAIGEHAHAGALRYFAKGSLSEEPHGELVARRYFEASLLTAFVTNKLLQEYEFAAACFNHGIYSPQGIIGEVCRSSSLRVVNWNIAYRHRCFIFSHGDTYHHTLLSEPRGAWEGIPWNPGMENQLLAYLRSRWSGTRDWIWFHDKPDENFGSLARQLGLDLDRPTIGMLTNVMWDAQLHYRASAFPNMLSWVIQSIEYFARRPDLQLLIRVHPAEIRGTLRSRQPILEEIKRVFPTLPPNVFALPPDSAVSTYAAMARCNAVIIYGTKTGVELASIGIPVIVAGEAWIRNKGLTLDASSPAEYFRILDGLPIRRPLELECVTRARKYAYHFFFRRMIPIACLEPTGAWPPYRVAISRLDDLLPGKDPGLDIVCNGILSGSPFVYPAETLGIHDA